MDHPKTVEVGQKWNHTSLKYGPVTVTDIRKFPRLEDGNEIEWVIFNNDMMRETTQTVLDNYQYEGMA